MPRPCAVESHAHRYKRQFRRVFRCHGLVPWRLTLTATKDNSEGFSDATALCRGDSRSPLQKTIQKGFQMPRPCAVETHAHRYKRQFRRVFRCHGLVPWRLTLTATKDKLEGFSDATALCRGDSRSPLQKTIQKGFQMPRPCAVESHAHRYKRQSEEFSDATALCRGVSRSPLQKTIQKGFQMPRPCAVETHAHRYKRQFRRVFRCHGLVPWRLTLTATKDNSEGFSDATALCRGDSRSPLQKTIQKGFQMPRPCAVETHARRYKRQLEGFSDATALCRGDSRSPLQKTIQKGFQMPRPCAVESHGFC